jgi:spore cortex formation protein SpoVR/YcgB (stage V sporulation)
MMNLSFRTYLNKEICEELNLFSYSKKKKEWTIDDIADEGGWKQIRSDLIKNVGLNSFQTFTSKSCRRITLWFLSMSMMAEI